ncbi:MAG: ribose 5-phosphate isomerase B [Phaeodactylibacter sp.]|nr:ribose 5-phosphate isomerase B [Phaeodactylibacter sp.]MCB9272724.1 ribose 5-phosphate isomerase B [Lewinellaceae bacterium]
MKTNTVAIGCDHAGFPYKKAILALLGELGIEVLDFGTDAPDSADYPDFVHPVADKVEQGQAGLGIVMCGSGNGVAMTANKHQGIRAALCWQEEVARLARSHNNANVLAIPVRFIPEAEALAIVKVFLETDFEGGRHARRVDKIALK